LEDGLSYKDLVREEVEKNLIFVGFFICDSPLKRDTQK